MSQLGKRGNMKRKSPQKLYNLSPSLAMEVGVLVAIILFLGLLIFIMGTKFVPEKFNLTFFSNHMVPILTLYGTVCLAYEFITAFRNESNKAFINQELTKEKENRYAAQSTMTNETDKNNRIMELNEKIVTLESDLAHEMKHTKRKFSVAWFGLTLLVIATLLQIWAG